MILSTLVTISHTIKEFTMWELNYYVVGIEKELVGDENSRPDVAIMFYSLKDLVCGRHYPIY